MAASYVAQSAVQAGKAAEIAAERKSAKYIGLSSSYIFILVAVESLGPLADDAHRFITEIGRRMTFSTGIREKRRSCTNASQWRFNATTPCVLQHFHFVLFIPDIIIFIVIIVVVIIIIIIIIITDSIRILARKGSPGRTIGRW